MADIVLNVGGMACSGCASAVEAAVKKVAPAAAVAVDLKDGKVTVSGGEASKDKLADAITRAGYEIRA
ncbi:MAG: heavy-metal-associated domain-containing protein [Proteobacteria bacterium]|nr:heavy-metal-associated domain-containing protein [Pseudomonadota bacterium]